MVCSYNESWPDYSGPVFPSTDGTPPEVGESLTEADLGAAKDDHEEERGEQVHPEVDDDH